MQDDDDAARPTTPNPDDAPDQGTVAAERTDEEQSDADAEGEEQSDADAEGEEQSDADETTQVEGVDTEHVMNLTFVLTLLLGVPTVVVLSLFVPLDGWGEILSFVVRVGAGIWFLTAVALYVRERRRT